jgi:hypothetical protein
MCYAICGILLVRYVAGVPGCTFPPECTKLTTCASCVIGDDPSNHGLQILQRPDFFPPNSLLSLNSYTLDYPCNTSCKWDKLRKSCTDLPRSSPMNDRVNFVYPLDLGMPESALFDLYSRMAASKYCESETGNSCREVRMPFAPSWLIGSRRNTCGRCYVPSVHAFPHRLLSLLWTLSELYAVLHHLATLPQTFHLKCRSRAPLRQRLIAFILPRTSFFKTGIDSGFTALMGNVE